MSNYPTFTWNGNTYNYLPSITNVSIPLELGGFRTTRMLEATVRIYDIDEYNNATNLFNYVYPQAQQKFVNNGEGITYRINSVRMDRDNTFFRITAYEVNKGV